MRAGYIDGIKEASFRTDLPEPQITQDNQVKIRVRSTGICGSEIHAYHGLHAWRVPPLVSGHEFAGDIVEVGSGVKDYKVGDRVTAEPQYGCGECPLCKKGKYNLCADKKILGATYWSGSFGEYIVTPESTLVRLSDDVSYDEGALIEPIAVGMHAVRTNNVSEQDTVVIIGVGTIGLGVYLSAKIFNPKKIILIDVVEFNLEKAKEMGAEHVINSAKEDVLAKVMELTDGQGADITFLAFGNAATVKQAAQVTTRGGIVSEIAVMPDGVAFPYPDLQIKELTLVGSNMYVREDYEVVCQAIGDGKMDLSKFITKTYPIEQMPEAMEVMDKRAEPIVKIMLQF